MALQIMQKKGMLIENKRNVRRVFQRILPDWNHDLHVHSNWSEDNLKGPAMAEYMPLAERYKIHIGFADHFELLYASPAYIDPKKEKWRLTMDSIDKYLEEIDALKARYPFVSSGLELDYYPSRETALQEFVDDYRHDFDLFIGSLHELEDYRPVTLKQDFEWLLQRYGSLDALTDKYFGMLAQMIESRIFDVIAHLNVVYRFFTAEDREKNPSLSPETRLMELAQSCSKSKTLLEVNLSGLRYAWGQSFPPISLLKPLVAQGVEFIVGSDSHSTADFQKSVLDIRKYHNLIRI